MLDIGCNDGTVTVELGSLTTAITSVLTELRFCLAKKCEVKSIDGIDIDPKLIAKAKTKEIDPVRSLHSLLANADFYVGCFVS